MIKEPRCSIRQCIHYKGVHRLGREEVSEANFCNAFAGMIPNEIAYGDNLHLSPIKGQKNKVVFEKVKK
jgi:hypothetical protein